VAYEEYQSGLEKQKLKDSTCKFCDKVFEGKNSTYNCKSHMYTMSRGYCPQSDITRETKGRELAALGKIKNASDYLACPAVGCPVVFATEMAAEAKRENEEVK
jgi:hypothetical protein